MTIRLHLSGAMPRAVLLAVIVALTPLPVAADTPKASSDKKTSLREAAASVDARHFAVVPAASKPAARADQATNPATRSSSFFTTKAGIAVLAVFAAGVGYAIYSTQNDRVKSPAKE